MTAPFDFNDSPNFKQVMRDFLPATTHTPFHHSLQHTNRARQSHTQRQSRDGARPSVCPAKTRLSLARGRSGEPSAQTLSSSDHSRTSVLIRRGAEEA